MDKMLEKLVELDDDARRQYLDARAAFTAWEQAVKSAAEVRGGMHWQTKNGRDYLFRTTTHGSQKGLGPRSEETELVHRNFSARKESLRQRVADLNEALVRHGKMNRALGVGRAPRMLIDILDRIGRLGLDEFFTVIGTHALYAYETAAGVRLGDPAAMATKDVDLFWNVRKRLVFLAKMKGLETSFLGLLQKVDPTFELRPEQRYTAVNSRGFEVDVIRREAVGDDPHPLRLTEDDGDFSVVQARRAGMLQDGAKFSCMIVAASGHMARMNTVSPRVFVKFKRWMAGLPDRDPLKRRRDLLQAELVTGLIEEYLPQELASTDTNLQNE